MNPRLRPVHVIPMVHQGRRALLLRDPLHLTERVIIVPQQLGPVLALMDGTRSLEEMRASLMVRAGLQVTNGDLAHIVEQLDQALLLQNQRFVEACDAALRSYRQAPYRPPSSAGASYPSDPDQLAAMLDGFLLIIPFARKGLSIYFQLSHANNNVKTISPANCISSGPERLRYLANANNG